MFSPEYYTEKEGGMWKKFDPKEGWHPLDTRLLKQRSKTSVTIKGIEVHSIAFDDPACGIGNFVRWDCINGFSI